MATEIVKDKTNLPAEVNLEEYANSGMETVSVKDMAVPFIKILQGLSPEISKKKPEYIEGAEEGLLCNTVSGEIYESIQFIPCFFNSCVNEWRPNRGGFVATHNNSDIVVQTAMRTTENKLVTKLGNELVDTANWYVLFNSTGILEAPELWNWGVIACTMTSLKKSRKLMSQLQAIKIHGKNGTFTPPLFTHIIDACTVPESNDKGDFCNWKFSFNEKKSYEVKGLFEAAKIFNEQIKSGLVKVTPAEEGVF